MRRGPGRGVGIHGIQKKTQLTEKLKSTGAKLESLQTERLKERMEFFKKNLEEFAKKHKNDINKDPEFRHHFHQMCLKIGVDPLASSKGFWAELLGYGDFYYELAVQIAEICLKTRAQNGGIIELSELTQRLQKHRGRSAAKISSDDVLQSIRSMKPLGNGYGLLKIGGKTFIQSVPCILDVDHQAILQVAQNHNAHVTKEKLVEMLSWSPDRVDKTLNVLLQEGIAWIDDQESEREYWFPGLIPDLLTLESE